MIFGHVIELDPTPENIVAFSKAFGCSRVAYNWCLNRYNEYRSQGVKISTMTLKKEFNSIKREIYPWIYESPKDANETPFSNFDASLQRFFSNVKKKSKRGKKNPYGFPALKKKDSKQSFGISNDRFCFLDGCVKLPVIGLVKTKERLRLDGKILGGSISKKGERYFISVNVEVQDFNRIRTSDGEVGIDLGFKDTIVTSDGMKYSIPEKIKALDGKIKKLHQNLSRKIKGSANKNKAKATLRKLYYRQRCMKLDWIHKMTTKLVQENQLIAIEDLNVAGMKALFGKSVMNSCLGEIRRQLQYKGLIYGSEVHVIDRWFPSSKSCNSCGSIKKDLKLSERTYTCIECGHVDDRDINAAKNILDVAKNTLSYREINVCGDTASGSELCSELSGIGEAERRKLHIGAIRYNGEFGD